MNKFLLLIFVFSISRGQNKIELNKEGVIPIVTEVEGKSAEDLYLKTKEWIQLNYKSPSEVLKADIKNDMIRINGFSKGFFTSKYVITNYFDVDYNIEFLFKDGKYKYIFTINDVTTQGKKIFYTVPSEFFKKDGTVRSTYSDAYATLLSSINDLYISHYNYISGKTQTVKNDW